MLPSSQVLRHLGEVVENALGVSEGSKVGGVRVQNIDLNTKRYDNHCLVVIAVTDNSLVRKIGSIPWAYGPFDTQLRHMSDIVVDIIEDQICSTANILGNIIAQTGADRAASASQRRHEAAFLGATG